MSELGITPTKARTAIAGRRSRKGSRAEVLTIQVLIVVAFLALWEYLPQIKFLSSRYKFLDPFFISSPSRIVSILGNLATGSNGNVLIWPYVWNTMSSALLGMVIGMALGGASGLLLSNSQYISRIMQPFLVALNAIPRIALIPVIDIIVGPTFESSVIVGVTVVFFLALYNAYEGGRTVAPQVLQNAQLMEASRFQIAIHVRLPYAFAWIMATLPLATTFALLSVVTCEILTGTSGLGGLIELALADSNANLTFAVVVVLSVVGIVVTAAAIYTRRYLLRWWDAQLT